MNIPYLNETIQTVIRIARSLAREYGNASYSAPHLLNAVLHKEIGLHAFLIYLGADIPYLKEWAEVRIEEYPKGNASEINGDDSITRVIEEADAVRATFGILEIDSKCLLCALIKPGIGFTPDQLKSFPLREKDILGMVQKDTIMQNTAIELGINNSALISQNTVSKYCINKNQLAEEGKLHLITGRENENRTVMEILGRYNRPNVILTGDAGVGKTAIVDGVTRNITNGKIPHYLTGAIIYELDMGALIAGATYKGEIEERLSNIIKGVQKQEKAILFIDDIHILLDNRNGDSGAVSILKQELSKGNLTVIGATTTDEYRKIIERDSAFNRRFEEVHITEPDIKTAFRIIKQVYSQYKEYHQIIATESALMTCVSLAKRYIKDRRLPDSAIDLLDRAMSSVKLINNTAQDTLKELRQELSDINKSSFTPEEKANALSTLHISMYCKLSPIITGLIPDQCNGIDNPAILAELIEKDFVTIAEMIENKISNITEHEISAIVAAKTGIPIGKIQAGEKNKLLGLENILRQRVVGQDYALKVLADAILESRSGMNKPGQPIGSFFFLGPTGTGKTELAKALAEALFNDEKAMIRFDMSEFKESHSAALLYGAPPGYVGYEEGGLLVNKIRQQPYSVVLFDEIEKAHPSVYDTFLQIMDEGKLHDRLGKEGDFSNSVVLFTSNIGSEWLMEQMMAGKEITSRELMELMGSTFKPEFLARLSEIIPFAPIDEIMLQKIFNIQLKSLAILLKKQGIDIEVTKEASTFLAKKNFSVKYGARQIAGTIRNFIAKPISRLIISGKISNGSIIKISMNNNTELIWEYKPEK